MHEKRSKIRLSRETFRNLTYLPREDHEKVVGGSPGAGLITCSSISWPLRCIPTTNAGCT